ncbi:phosphatidylinositol-specific phospholipase C1-like protein [Acidipila sp. EB88]|uniref:phosphatidylinositol-specific phospholipase C1-like protein n=1 Tax=Acidipila sp. EB88 TaxID=2305226 RepID=UPI000F5E3CE8|nr:phosphatidylinositol-specific phospholipase C1-like protein [Acidipila sp. EB88]RRA47243.1 hypothetical protein D1Y84_01995 [Acidipila sp. EB88]
MHRVVCSALLGFATVAVAVAEGGDGAVRINQIQVVGTHNSYHAGLTPGVAKLLQAKSPKTFAALDYTHPSLTAQLDAGVRQLEIDVFADSKGGLYAHPYMEKMVTDAGGTGDPDPDPNGVMDKPGFKVMHVQDIDQRSVCEPFTACLAEVRAWSKAHPQHLPVFLLIETKQGKLKTADFPSVTPENFTPAVFDALDAEIRSVFAAGELITPDMVRGSAATLNAAVLAGNWPTLDAARGKVVFLMDQRPMEPVYTEGHPSLRGRVIFTNAAPGAPDAAFTEENDGSVDEINALVRQGYLVRTRTDADTVQARTNDTRRRDAVMASGAQILSTDYPLGAAAPSGFVVSMPGGTLARCNPVLKTATCDDKQLEGSRAAR